MWQGEAHQVGVIFVILAAPGTQPETPTVGVHQDVWTSRAADSEPGHFLPSSLHSPYACLQDRDVGS
jgi:hypothetical protein